MVEGFARWDDDSAMLVRYEDLVAPGFPLEQLATHARLGSIDPAPLSRRLRGMSKPRMSLEVREVEAITRTVGPWAEAIGYGAPSLAGVSCRFARTTFSSIPASASSA